MIWFEQLSCLPNFMLFPTYKLNCQGKRKKLSNDKNLSEEKFSAVEISLDTGFPTYHLLSRQKD